MGLDDFKKEDASASNGTAHSSVNSVVDDDSSVDDVVEAMTELVDELGYRPTVKEWNNMRDFTGISTRGGHFNRDLGHTFTEIQEMADNIDDSEIHKKSESVHGKTINTEEKARMYVNKMKEYLGHIPSTQEWNNNREEIGVSTKTMNFKQNIGKGFHQVLSEVFDDYRSGVECVTCSEVYRNIGKHIQQSECEYPEINSYTESLLIGMQMSDGWVTKGESGSILHAKMINKEFLEWYITQLSIFTSGVTMELAASEIAEQARETSFSPSAKEKNYNDIYRIHTMTHPYIDNIKELDLESIELDSDIVKIWYCGDGGLHWSENSVYAKLTKKGTYSEIGMLADKFGELGFDVTVDDIHNGAKVIRFKSSSTEKLLEWIGPSPPGFEYKWEVESKEMYEKLKNRLYS